MFLLELVPLTSVLFLPLIPESPRFLLVIRQKRDAAEAGATLTIPMTSQLTSKHFLYFSSTALRYFYEKHDVAPDLEEIETENNGNATEVGRVTVLALLFRTPETWRPLIVACALQVIQQFSGINAVRSTVAVLLQDKVA